LNVKLNRIRGIDDAMVSMYMSKRTYTDEIDEHIRKLVNDNICYNTGFLKHSLSKEFKNELQKIFKYGSDFGHTTLLKYIDLSFTITGLHRAGQDDLDSHAERMDSRIVRASTRLGSFNSGEKSEYYQDKILTTEEVCKMLNVNLPPVVSVDGYDFVKTEHGYIKEEYIDDQDVIRGLYRLMIPSNCIFKISLPQFCHIYQHRNYDSHAHPELQKCIEMCADEIKLNMPLAYEYLTKLKMQPKEV
jgi:hypothetical protein